MNIHLSCDLGEATDAAARTTEERIWPLIAAVNVACGGHAGDASSMREAAVLARELDVRLGAHPSYPDREHFGRRSMSITTDQLHASLVEQLSHFRELALEEGVPLLHVKPHGALYNEAHTDRTLSHVIIAAMNDVDRSLALVAAETSQMAVAARETGTALIREAFADRRYEPDGSLTPRTVAGSLLSVEEAAAQALQLAQSGTVIARDGSVISIAFDTVCVHADMEHSVERLMRIREVLEIS